jgi:hypothetical protein
MNHRMTVSFSAPSSVRQIPRRAQVSLDGAPLAFHSGFLDLRVGEDLVSIVSLSAR